VYPNRAERLATGSRGRFEYIAKPPSKWRWSCTLKLIIEILKSGTHHMEKQSKFRRIAGSTPQVTMLMLALGARSLAFAVDSPRAIHVFVALADNKTQGIVPVPAKIGNGDDPANNLYWGCSEGLKEFFRGSRDWKLIGTPAPPKPQILERCIFERKSPQAILVADAYRGSEIKQCIEDLLNASGGNDGATVETTVGSVATNGNANLIAYIGHDGLMDFQLHPSPSGSGGRGKPVIVLCCKSADFFSEPLNRAGARPLLLTTQLMYPGSFILDSAIEGWLRGESIVAIRERAARAYAANQHISVKSARGVFSELHGTN
jgi:hypothetical protein